MRKLILLLLIFMGFAYENADITSNKNQVSNTYLERVEPPNWWIDFKDTSLQLLVKENNIGASKPSISYKGVRIEKVHSAKSNNYLFIDLVIDKNTKSGKFDILFSFEDGKTKTHTYELKDRQKSPEKYVGFNSSDAIYLITPDRFSNGIESNDINQNLNEKTINRKDNYARHGGDIKGITNNINYIADLGFTTVWPCPVLTNDMFSGSYHGYAITDFYEVDSRFGTLSEYKELANELDKKGMKLIMDQVANHCGIEHWWMKDFPFEDWVNNQKYYEENKENWNHKTVKVSNHRRTTNQDSYASKSDRNGNNEGWFVDTMPDLNQRNPFMANYIIQNSIWWIETLGLGGIRQDTYPYSDKQFMSNWAGAIMNEYPNFSIVGEEWSYNPLLIGYWQKGAKNKDGYESNLRSTMDFAMQNNIISAFNENETWDTGLVKIYEGLANDFHYVTPKDILIFGDNHDMSRIFTQLKGDIINTKMALSYLLMLPRIPQIYYGTEILMNDFEKPGDHGLIRTDFPGGWNGDIVNAFTGVGLTDAQKDMQLFIKKVLNFRRKSEAIHEGETLHFAPENGTYFLFRSKNDETIVHIINKNDKPISIDLNRFKEVGLQGKTLKNILTDEKILWNKTLELSKKGSIILTTKF
ncbi:MAG: glycoside hydrolase family 13 protein [Flavobacteriia bacterium]|nr:glycoside hydrolase family 13 protein [Flavobacteriia bacterium]OIP46139.1 MAG: alpha-amlyase [Flavobacteriaceae bacterium CG2_30_31_66]PIV96944.1 MAG: alpha-amlyase [Flavobacteriaceae bacterium CG17_big_fil_post_rev_8_21_14_2_50_31_13]PIX12899.1 MAG: alpha-amlyase [Flavobacteriaceae bacterium CG_4_8_14_3_um_filter_31_8]PIY15250.1 MAG: alpha-amlyase [Flavobacteriaceae bacterium CG_4_10_14_3_um_filter_31_253]PIZ12002.1 MAG: alpha-amlyase [Flavobacteriaceae bacterium CG_4_10_14_0_8_um_filter_